MPKIYKYREFGDENHLSLLSDWEIFLADPDCFHDPNDCAVDIRLGPSPSNEFLQSLKETLREAHPFVSKTEIEDRIQDLIEEDQLIDGTVFRNQVAGSVGVCSFACNPSTPQIWRKYAQSHTGFCVQFDFDRLNEWCDAKSSPDKGRGYFLSRVEYPSKPPVLSATELSAAEVFQKAVTIKRRKYRWEDEYRMVSNDAVHEARQVPEETIDSVAVGLGAPQSDLEETVETVNQYAKKVQVLKASSVSGKVRFREVGVF